MHPYGPRVQSLLEMQSQSVPHWQEVHSRRSALFKKQNLFLYYCSHVDVKINILQRPSLITCSPDGLLLQLLLGLRALLLSKEAESAGHEKLCGCLPKSVTDGIDSED